MAELAWREAFPPNGLTSTQVTAMIRVLSGRPHLGLLQLQPVVVFELWITRDRARWLLGCDNQIARHLPGDLAAQVPGLTFGAVDESPRTMPITAREIRPTSTAYPLRLDMAGSAATALLQLRHRLGADESIVVSWTIGPSHDRATAQPTQPSMLEWLGMTTPRKPDTGERAAWTQKVAEPLFGVRGRVGAVADDLKRAAQLIGPVISALSLASGPHARLESSWQSSRVARQLFQVVGPVRTWSGVVNAGELGILLGWPVDGVAIPGRGSRLSQPPRKLLIGRRPQKITGHDRIIGTSVDPRSKDLMVRIPAASLASHTHLIGVTGSGKSTMLARWLLSDIEAGKSIVLVDPKGDLITDLLSLLDQRHLDQIRLIEPGSGGPVLGFNPLAGPLDEAERRADSLLRLFREVFGGSLGPRSSDVLLHALIVAARLPDGTLPDVSVILTDNAFRRHALAQVSDPLTIAPWAAWFDGLSDLERSRVIAPILNKLRVFTARSPIRRILGQPNPAVRLDELYEKQLVVLLNLNVGVLGLETSRLLGSIYLGRLAETVQRQATVRAAKRRPVSVVVDEWQTVTAGMDFADMLATARGMNTSFTLAHQHLAQLTPSLRTAALANCRSRVAWRPAKADAKDLAGVLGGAITADELMRLPAYHAVAQVLVDGSTSDPFEVRTLPLPAATQDPDAARHQLAHRFGVDPAQLDAQLIQRWQGGGTTPSGGIGMKKRGVI